MVCVALLSNPKSTGNRAMLPRVRSYCANHPDIFHYEVEHVDQIGRALQTIARVNPAVIVINGGDGTVQAALTELYQGEHFKGKVPPIAVLPNGKTNLIALDLGTYGDPLKALDRIIEIAKTGVDGYVVARELIALSDGQCRPVLGMFLGGAGLADYILYCRNRIYPLGLSNGLSHFLTAVAVILSLLLGISGKYMPPKTRPIKVSLIRDGQLRGRFSLLIVTTLERLLLGARTGDGTEPAGSMKLMAVDQSIPALFRMLFASVSGRLGRQKLSGIHLERGDMIRIEGDQSSVILDGELFQAEKGKPIVLTSTAPVPFLRLAA